MPKFFCDYCDVYLTHDSMSVRKAHNSGRNHLRNVVDYYQQIGQDAAQGVIDNITNSYADQPHNNPMLQHLGHGGFGHPGGFGGGFHPPPGPFGHPAMPPMPFPQGGRGMPMLPQGLPPGFIPPPQGLPPGFVPQQQGFPSHGSPPAGMPFPPPGQRGPPGHGMPPGFPPQMSNGGHPGMNGGSSGSGPPRGPH